jgi:SAM-dependent methyltransferase
MGFSDRWCSLIRTLWSSSAYCVIIWMVSVEAIRLQQPGAADVGMHPGSDEPRLERIGMERRTSMRGQPDRTPINPEEDVYDRLKPDIFARIGKELKTARTILDVGCGDCQLVNFLARNTSNRVVGIDVSDDDLEKGRQEADRQGIFRLVDCRKVDAHHLEGFDGNVFDAAVMVYALHELSRPILVLRQIHRVLKDRGKLLIVDFPKGSRAEELWGERYFSPAQVKSMLTRAKFSESGVSCPYGEELLLFARARKCEK